MAHLLIIELPGGNDTDIIEACLLKKNSFTFLTQNISLYKKKDQTYRWVSQAENVIESQLFDYQEVEQSVIESNKNKKIDAVICLIDIRLIEASRLAQRLGLRYLNPDSAMLLRDKYSVREKLKNEGIDQPLFELATTNTQVMHAIQKVGLPVLIKPSDGYGSQNILTIENSDDLELARPNLENLLPISNDYGLGVRSNDRLLIERFMHGTLIGCDTFTLNGRHQLLGVNEKLMFSPPSFAIRGGCFMPNLGEWKELETYLFRILDAVGFDCGATHIEIILTDQGPRLVEINPRLVGAKIARLISLSLNRSIHDALINLHLGNWTLDDLALKQMKPSVTRWLTSEVTGVLERIELPQWTDDGIQCVEIFSQPGNRVSFPFENAHRMGYVMTRCQTRQAAETLAEKYISDCQIKLSTSLKEPTN